MGCRASLCLRRTVPPVTSHSPPPRKIKRQQNHACTAEQSASWGGGGLLTDRLTAIVCLIAAFVLGIAGRGTCYALGILTTFLTVAEQAVGAVGIDRVVRVLTVVAIARIPVPVVICVGCALLERVAERAEVRAPAVGVRFAVKG